MTRVFCVLSVLVLGLAPPASADLLGLNVSAVERNSFLGTTDTSGFAPSATFTVGAGVEAAYTFVVSPTTIDFGATSLTLQFQGAELVLFPMAFLGFDFTTSVPHGITGFSVAGTTVAGFDASDVTITPTGISVNLESLVLTLQTPVVIDFTFAQPVAVPAPAAIGLLALGLGGLVATHRRCIV